MKVEARGQLAESFLSFYYVGLRDQTQVIKLGSRSLYPLSHLADLKNLEFIRNIPLEVPPLRF